MKSKAFLALAALVLASCATRPGPKTVATADYKGKCLNDHPVCHVAVTVKDCRVAVDPEWKHVSSRPGGVQMLWTLRDSPGVEFSGNGIAFKPHVADSRRVFRTEGTTLGRQTFSMHNDTTPGKYPYTVNVIDNGKRCEPHDPGVINEM